MRKTVRAVMLLGILLMSGAGIAAQQEEQSIEDRLVAFTHQLRMSLTLATVAAHSPTIIDLRLHAQQLINLLEGADGTHFVRPAVSTEMPVGLLREIARLQTRFGQVQQDDDLTRVKAAAGNVSTYLEFALDAALAGLKQRRMDLATSDMLRAYAFLLAAYERPCDVAYVPALWTILRVYDLVSRLEANDESSI
ncbi:hypothetical protein ACFLSZ_04395 [Candidatus Bipolaricaulota bacterium]